MNKRRFYTQTDLQRLAHMAGVGTTDSNFRRTLAPWLADLDLGTRYGNKRTPLIYRRKEAMFVLTFMVYRHILKGLGKLGPSAHYYRSDFKEVKDFLTREENGHKQDAAMQQAIDTARSTLEQFDNQESQETPTA
jgi:hypothetical protein